MPFVVVYLILSACLVGVLARRDTFRQWRRESRRQRRGGIRPALMNDGFGLRISPGCKRCHGCDSHACHGSCSVAREDGKGGVS